MATKKRTGGRVTPKGTEPGAASPSRVAKVRVARPSDRTTESGSGRYTPPPVPKARFRPRWHRVAGWFGVALGIAVVVLNDAMRFSENLTLLPFGHQELYLILGLIVAGSSTWFLGLFDREPTIYL
jgi:hypothetical protein